MKKKILFLTCSLLFNPFAFADEKCFLAVDSHQIIQQDGVCQSRYSPASTFKIAISLMGYDAGLLIDETHPELPFQTGYEDWLEQWRQPHNPTLWMKNSTVWYSQVLTQQLGIERFKSYVEKFHYGNQDVSGDKGKNNALIRSWISSSLEISPEEQVIFLQKLLSQDLPVSFKAHQMTQNILFIEELPGGWKLYGKTGNSAQLSQDRSQRLELQQGWFVGWVKKGARSIVFAMHIADDTKQDTYASLRAKSEAKERLLHLLKVVK